MKLSIPDRYRHRLPGLLVFLFLYLFSVALHGQQTLTVVDENQRPLPGVNVFTADLSFSGVTDQQGKLQLKELPEATQLRFTYIGYRDLLLSLEAIGSKGWIIAMEPATETLAEVIITGRRDDRSTDIPYAVLRIDQEDLAMTNPQTSADALRDHGELFVQKSQMGGGSPIIRGFEANRVLLVLDGVRLNNAIYRSGHLQNAITVDQGMLEQMEVIFGPGSLIYGSDALGGVVHFRSKDPQLALGEARRQVGANAYLRYASANQEKTGHVDVNLGGRRWGSLTSITYTDFGDLRAGANRPGGYEGFGLRPEYVVRRNGQDVIVPNDDPNVQRPTGYSQIDLMQKIRFQPNSGMYFIGNLQFSTSGDVPRYDNLTEYRNGQLRWADWHYGPQTRLLASLRARLVAPSPLYDHATIIAAYQFIEEDRITRRLNNPRQESSLVDVNVYSFTADFDKPLSADDRHELAYGVDLNHNQVDSEGFLTDVNTGKRAGDLPTRYPSQGSRLSSFGAYTNYRWRSPDQVFVFNAGLRYTYNRLFARFGTGDPVQWPSFYLDGITGVNDAFTWAAGLTLNLPERWQVRALSATGFRAPNMNDFAAFREQNGFISVPNPDLEPERSWTSELTVGKTVGSTKGLSAKFSLTGFYTRLQNAIVRANFTLPDGSPFFLNQGDTLFVQANVNAEKGHLYGLSGNVLLRLGKQWQLRSGINYTYGRRSYLDRNENGQVLIDTLIPLDHIPPLYGQTSLRYQSGKISLELTLRYNGRKDPQDYGIASIQRVGNTVIVDREGTEDNIELGAVDPLTGAYRGVYGWTTVNLYGTWKLNKNIQINLGLENLADLHYRSFASGLSGPGRNFIAAIRGSF